MAPVAFIHPRGSMNTATTRSTANGAVLQVMVRGASTRPRASTATAPAPTSASGAVPPPTAPAASTARPASMRSKKMVRIAGQLCSSNEVKMASIAFLDVILSQV